MFGYDPQSGPFQVGDITTVTLSQAEMANLEGDARPVPGGGDVNVLAEGDGDAGTFDSTTDFALDLTGQYTSTFADLLWTLRTSAGRNGESIEAGVEPRPWTRIRARRDRLRPRSDPAGGRAGTGRHQKADRGQLNANKARSVFPATCRESRL